MAGYSERRYDAEGNQISFARPPLLSRTGLAGPDNVWFTSDDTLSVTGFAFDDRHRPIRLTTYAGPGADAAWYTPDDEVRAYTDTRYHDDHGIAEQVSYNGTGAIQSWMRGELVDVRTVRLVKFKLAGVDMIWRTEDDVISGYELMKWNELGQPTLSASIYDAGEDLEWFTDDDHVWNYQTREYDARGDLSRRSVYVDFGVTRRFTETFEYDDRGLLILAIYQVGPGDDGEWFTSDDVVGGYTEYAYEQNGNRRMRKRFYGGGPGMDAEWFTDDDVLSDMDEFDATL